MFAIPAGQGRAPIYPESEVEFFLRIVDAQLTFTTDEAGEVDGLILHQGGRDQRAERIG